MRPASSKKRVIMDYRNITGAVLEMFMDRYPYGYEDDVVKYQNSKGEWIASVPIETPDTKYLIKVGVEMDKRIEAFLLDEEESSSTNGIPEVSETVPLPDPEPEE